MDQASAYPGRTGDQWRVVVTKGLGASNKIARITFSLLLLLALVPRSGYAQEAIPHPEQPFSEANGLMPKDSPPPHWPARPQALPEGAPNVLLIMSDDVGFGAGSTFGGPVPTPTMDALAKAGLRYTEFNVTAVCSSTRAALLTGRNHHQVGMGVVAEVASGYDGYTTVIPKNADTIAQILAGNGYATAVIGKWHVTPVWEEGPQGPFDHWPTHMGFDFFYGFLDGATNQFAPANVIEGTTPVEPALGHPHYHFDEDMADHAIAWIREEKSLTPNRPFFLYYAPGTSHSPHQAPADWIEKFKGQFDQGWDQVREETFERQKKLGVIPAKALLTPRPSTIPAWNSLNDDQKKVYAREMEVYAGALSHMDYQIGRVIQSLRDMGMLHNTLVIYIQGDNGASELAGANGSLNDSAMYNGEKEPFSDFKRRIDELGGPNTLEDYAAGWGYAMNTPFQWAKGIASHFGGTRDGMVISWPDRIKDDGGIRTQFHHIIDLLPTILDVAHIPAPEYVDGIKQQPIQGVSMTYTFDHPDAPSTRTTQYFEMMENAAIYHDGWIAATTPIVTQNILTSKIKAVDRDDLDQRPWELYDITKDFSEAVNLAQKYPQKLEELRDLFWVEAARNHVLPIHGPNMRGLLEMIHGGEKNLTFYPGTIFVPQAAAPDFDNRSFKITGVVDIPAGANGVIASQGGRFGGFGFYLLNGKLVYCYNFFNMARYTVVSPDQIAPGKHSLAIEFKYDGGGIGKGGTATLFDGGKILAKGRVDQTSNGIIEGMEGSFDVGEGHGTPVDGNYEVPFKLSGKLEKVVVDIETTPGSR